MAVVQDEPEILPRMLVPGPRDATPPNPTFPTYPGIALKQPALWSR